MLLIQYTLIYASVLIFVAFGGMFSERSGVINLGLEGTMVMGALGGAFILYSLPAGTPAICIILLTILTSIVFGMLYSLFLAVAAINFKADQTLVGTAMNMLATAASVVIVKSFNNARSAGQNPSAILDYIQNRKVFLLGDFNIYMILTLILIAVGYVVLFKTRFGLRLMACGEHPQAAASVGINVFKMRYSGVLISGLCGGVGGIIYISAANSQWDFMYGVAGAGFLALAVMIFGQWNPLKIAASALLFGAFRAIADTYSAFDFLIHLVPGDVYKMLPYIISLIVLAFTSQNSRAPKAEGIPYDKGTR
ncbi:Putative ABC-type transport system, permease component [Treponema sp. JC4]|uniref:ABC transporter permease n=1 Tax=Treponema sp. JC4 TaxID=1124982 RepID=UPI00025B02A0|nr:ABC transporter permease [Treponema sp. JC4]EID85497.1 Putative ABC-type transport system, permease component [Treponema sp. JC4]